MKNRDIMHQKKHHLSITVYLLIITWLLTACGQPATTSDTYLQTQLVVNAQTDLSLPPTLTPLVLPTRIPGQPVPTPTPDPPRVLPPIRQETSQHVVQAYDTLAVIARNYQTDINLIIEANNIINPNFLEIGTTLVIPPPNLVETGPSFKIIPDSELVNGPVNAYFDTIAYINSRNSFLSHYTEIIAGQEMTGGDIVQRIASDYSVNPRILLALLEYESSWVTSNQPGTDTHNYPMGYSDPDKAGLYRQMAWAADNLNRGYYLWKVNALAYWVTSDSTFVPISPTINAGTAGVQHLLSLLLNYPDWKVAVSESGLFSVYNRLFGNPFDLSIEPLVPSDLTLPELQLPFENGKPWSFTGGPHGGWGNGSAWAALDFAPPGPALGCVQSEEWIVAIADGVVTKSENGLVSLDLDFDGFDRTGWVIIYAHIETRDRVPIGTLLKAGDRIGHPSCEGGVSTGTHVHIARQFNGEWISADGSLPFIMDGWISSGSGSVYNGYLTKNGRSVEAWEGRSPENEIQR
jgi:murein DD-endopeptidase MepM/ murein hydrolase activator NlpD